MSKAAPIRKLKLSVPAKEASMRLTLPLANGVHLALEIENGMVELYEEVDLVIEQTTFKRKEKKRR